MQSKALKIICVALAFAFFLPPVALGAGASDGVRDESYQEPLPPQESEGQEDGFPDTITPSPTPPEIAPPESPSIPTPEPTPEPEPMPEPTPKKAQYILIKADRLNVRTGASASYPPLGIAEKNTLLHFTKKQDGWYQTYYRNQTAYISANPAYTVLFSLDEVEDKTERVIEEGLKLLGTPYVYGAIRLHDGKGNYLKNFTEKKFDCSSLMQYIFHEGANVLLNVTTRTQVSQGSLVKKSQLKRGDLMFFTNASRYFKTGVERIGHVALYLGDNYILHTASDFAKIEQISEQRWSYYISARRMF